MILTAFSLHRGAAAYMAWLGRRWVLGCVVALGVALLALPALAAFTQGTAAELFFFLRQELAAPAEPGPRWHGSRIRSGAEDWG